jgi:signal transduction histidine kinase
MVARLSEARRKLLDQSYHSGVAELASGVLHNIGNAVTPLGVKVAKVKQDLRQAPLAEMEMAALELSDPHCPADRRQDLMQFVQLAGQELAGVVQRTAAEMDLVQNQLDHVQLILADQRRFSKAERVIETLPLNNLVDETVRLLPEALHRHVTIEIDPGLAEVGRVRAARVALQQIMSNLLINAAESIRQSGHKADTGRVRIHAVEEDQDGQGKVRLSVEDNGGGIAPDILSRLFERGFSTKNRGSGMGLHWSANTAAAMGGRLYAESPGPGLGAVFHLLLPTAQPTFNSQEITA